MGLADSASLLFRIKADGSQSIREIKQVEGAITGAGSAFSGLAGPAAIAGAAVAAIGLAAINTATALFNLAKSTSDFGSKIFDATEKTGLAAQTISALQVAADQSGSSLEGISKGLTRFTLLMGEANDGSDKAQAKLARLGVTSKDLDTALGQALKTIAALPPGIAQNTAAADAFGKKLGAELIPTIKSFNGDLPGLIAHLEKMGLTMSNADVQAADEFGDTLDTLTSQAAATGRQFALEFMPNVTNAMSTISKALAENKDAARGWGTAIGETVDGAVMAWQIGANAIGRVLDALGLSFLNSAEKARIAAGIIISAISPALGMLNLLGQMTPGVKAGMGGAVNIPTGGPSVSSPSGGGKGGGGGGGGSAGDNAEAARRKAVQAAKAEMQDTLEIYRAGYAERLALLDYNLAQKYTGEKEYIRDVGRIHLEALEDEKRLNEELLKNENLNLEERKDILNKIKVLTIEIATERIKTSTKVIEQIGKETKAEEEAHEKELKRLQAISDRRQQAFAQWQRERQERLRALKEEADARTLAGMAASGGGDFLGNIKDVFDDKGNLVSKGLGVIGSAFQELKSIGLDALGALASGIGNMVGQWVLMGNMGGQSLRKLTAQILAQVAMQAATMAIMCLAYAALATTVIGAAMLGGTPAQFLIAAAIFGSIAAITAGIGRAVAGNSFSQQTANGGSSASGSSDADLGNRPALNFTEKFEGFLRNQNDRLNVVLGGVVDAVDKFNEKFGVTTPDAVVMAGAGGASEQIFNAVGSHIESDLRGQSDLDRLSGRMR